jgi:hypothetical protein
MSKLVSIEAPAKVTFTGKEATYTLLNKEGAVGDVKETTAEIIKGILSQLFYFSGGKEKKAKENFSVEVTVSEEKQSATFSCNFDDEHLEQVDKKELCKTSAATLKSTLNAIDLINEKYEKGVKLIPLWDKNIQTYFQINDDTFTHQDKSSLSVVNDIIKLSKKLPVKSLQFSSGEEQLKLKETEFISPPIRKRVLLDSEVEIEGLLAGLQYNPGRNLKILEGAGTSDVTTLKTYIITKACAKFSELIQSPENSYMKIKLIKNTQNDMYSIESFKLLNQNDNLPDIKQVLREID